MICKYCNSEMRLDDKDRDFPGKYDNYWICNNCTGSCIEEVRFSQRFREIWHCENNNEVQDEIVKYQVHRGGAK